MKCPPKCFVEELYNYQKENMVFIHTSLQKIWFKECIIQLKRLSTFLLLLIKCILLLMFIWALDTQEKERRHPTGKTEAVKHKTGALAIEGNLFLFQNLL